MDMHGFTLVYTGKPPHGSRNQQLTDLANYLFLLFIYLFCEFIVLPIHTFTDPIAQNNNELKQLNTKQQTENWFSGLVFLWLFFYRFIVLPVYN